MSKDKTDGQGKGPTAGPPLWREVEMNPRPSIAYANHFAIYSSPDGIRIRFLNMAALDKSSALHGAESVMELTNLADIDLHPMLAKELLRRLAGAIDAYEQHLGVLPDLEEVRTAWANGVAMKKTGKSKSGKRKGY